MPPVIRIENLAKSYHIEHGQPRSQYRTFRETLTDLATAPLRRIRGETNGRSEEFWALKGVNLEVQKGEVIGIIGRNGAGKSTLLKILSRITAPTTGRVELHGRVGSLLEVGTGFHPELTGRENILLNGSILGMTRREIQRSFDEIVEFSGVEKFLDTPVKRYSSGMYVRLAFAVAAHLEPEIMIIDEVLAVGDAEFQRKCLGKMQDVAGHGRTVLFVSHNMAAVQRLCQRAVLLCGGVVSEQGETAGVVERYLRDNENGSTQISAILDGHCNRRPGSEIVLRKVQVFADGRESTVVPMGATLEILTTFQREPPIANMRFGIAIEDRSGQRLLAFSPTLQAPHLIREAFQQGTFRCEIPCIRLLPGSYYLTLIIGSGAADLDRVDRAVMFTIESTDVFRTGYAPGPNHGVFYQEANWQLTRS